MTELKIEQRPVAYLVTGPDGDENLTRQPLTEYDKKYGWTETPLFEQSLRPTAPDAVRGSTVKDSLTVEELEKPIELCVVRWEGRLQCAYLNDFRIAGGKPWGGGSTEKAWNTTLREVIRAFPSLQKALGFNYLGQPLRTEPTPTAPDETAVERVVSVIREWLLSTDHPISKWERNFAAAIIAAMGAKP